MAYATINKPTEHFNTKLYAGTNTPQSITGVGFQPDWTWIKGRNVADNHYIYDSVRGATKFVHSDLTNAEGTLTNGLTSFNSDGFSLGDSGSTNNSSYNFVSWNWLGANTTASNTNGSITSTVSANTSAGFSIVSWTGTGSAATIGHGLNSAPEFMLVKNRDKASQFAAYFSTIGATKYVAISDADNPATYSGYWNDTAPTSSVFSVGSDGDVSGAAGQKVIAYCFHSVKGYSKIGDYSPGVVGSSADTRPFIYTGFKPAFVLIKNTNNGGRDWVVYDNKRGLNGSIEYLKPNTTGAAGSTANLNIELYSNGFRVPGQNGEINTADGVQYSYIAIAEAPLVGTNGIPATAG